MKEFIHSDLGKIQVLVEIERTERYVSTGKHIALVKCYMVPREHKWDGTINGFDFKHARVGNIKPEYYLLWGNDQDLNNRGITHLQTQSGRAVSERSALKRLKEAHGAMQFVNFKPYIK